MANFTVSNLLAAQAMLSAQYQAPELRMQQVPVLTLLSANENFLTIDPNVSKQKNRPLKGYYLTRNKRTSGTARAANHTGTQGDSGSIDLVWTSKTDKFSISLKLLDDNVFGFNQVFASQLQQSCMNILEDKEAEAIAFLKAQRATAQPTLTVASFNATNDAVEVTDARKDQFFAVVKSVMRSNFFTGALDVFADSMLSLNASFVAAQGTGNATNYGYQFQGLNIAESVGLADANYTLGMGIAMPAGSACAKHWIPKENRQGWGDYMSSVGGYGTFEFLGYQFALHGYATQADNSANNGDPQDVVMQFELSLDTSYNRAPLSVIAGRTDSPIIEFGQLAVPEA